MEHNNISIIPYCEAFRLINTGNASKEDVYFDSSGRLRILLWRYDTNSYTSYFDD